MEKNQKSSFVYIFLVICVIDLLTMTWFPLGRMVAKPLIVGSLLSWYIVRLEKQHSLIISALVLAVVGDVALLFESDLFFMIGLGAFLLSHLCYWGYLRQFIEKNPSSLQKAFYYALPIVGIVFNFYIWDKTGSNRIPVLIYSAVLVLMATTAVMFPRLGKPISIIGIGALIFVVSDLTLAVAKFAWPLELLKYVVMTTYMAAQYLLVKGISDDAIDYFNRLKVKN